jgi:maltose alpha-D-glucosyltransferase/alpha-amylase
MPRIFMALRQEDRHPITEILRRMPEIPPTCQWALFLRNHDELTLEMVTDAQYVLNHERFLLERLQALRQVEAGITQIRCHGDYHLGQVLWVENNFVILDFEGEPARSLAERRRKFSPLKDVAGMLRSLSYAAYAALFAFLENRPADFPQIEPWAQFWQQWTSVSFMQGYLATVAGATFLPQESQHLATLLEGFLLDKVLYELDDELNHRPDWLRIPLQGIMQLLLPADLWPLDNPAY